jgi:hypothetical protein
MPDGRAFTKQELMAHGLPDVDIFMLDADGF